MKDLRYYKHYKGGIYKHVGIAKHSETKEEMVIYQGSDGQMWARPHSMFNEVIAYPEGQERLRFEPIGNEVPKEVSESLRMKFGKFKGYYEWDLAIEWFQTSNDAFFEKYGFNFVSKGKLFEDAKEYVYWNGRNNIQQNINIEIKQPDLARSDVLKEITKSLVKSSFNKMGY